MVMTCKTTIRGNNMANYKTGAQRYNDRMTKIFADAKVLKAKYGTRDCDCKNYGSKEPCKKSCASLMPPEGTNDIKKSMAKKMKRKKLENQLDNFIKHGRDKHDENIWKYARLNTMSDKRIF